MNRYRLCRCASAIRNELITLFLPVVGGGTVASTTNGCIRNQSRSYMRLRGDRMSISEPNKAIKNNLKMAWKNGNFEKNNLLIAKQAGYFTSQQNRRSSTDNFKVKRFYALSPIKWLDLKLKILLLKSFFDKEFDEEEFLEGAKQVICVVSSYISEEKFDLLDGLVTEKALAECKVVYNNTTDKKKLEIIRDDIDMIRISNIGFEYEGNGRKWADILVTCFCISEESVSKRIGNIEITGIPSQRVFNLALIRDYTPGVTSNWIVDRIDIYKNFV